jgi:hypothetical protein
LAPRAAFAVERLYTDHIRSVYRRRERGLGGAAKAPGSGKCLIQAARTRPGSPDAARETAKNIADQIAPLLKRARAKGFDFLAYLLAMALKESRRLSEE